MIWAFPKMTTNSTATGRFRDQQRLELSAAEGKPWIHVVPAAGEHAGVISIPAGYDVPGLGIAEEATEVAGTTVFTDENLDKMVARFSGEVLVDYEHFSHDQDKTTEAAGWGEALRRTADGLEMETDWADPAREKILTKVYRYISPEFSGSVRYEGGTYKFYPTALTGAGLTNRPKLTALRPVSVNRDKQTNTDMKALTLLCSLIGASTTDSEDVLEQKTTALQAEIAALKGDKATSENRAARATQLETENKKLREEAITADLARFADVIDDADNARELLQLNRETAVKFFEGVQAKITKPNGTDGKPLFQKNRATPPDGSEVPPSGSSSTWRAML